MNFTPWSKAEDVRGLGTPGRDATSDGGGSLRAIRVGAPVACLFQPTTNFNYE
jgi:hypothetical protein